MVAHPQRIAVVKETNFGVIFPAVRAPHWVPSFLVGIANVGKDSYLYTTLECTSGRSGKTYGSTDSTSVSPEGNARCRLF